ncbi:MAG TPA: TetR family transcriptional regulator [Chitinophagaceae bacterium]|nr:TetR family transcriptional regulator [Chitinophagaceae bacterium]
MEYSDKQIQIMEAAEKLFADKGFTGTSVRDIAESADINLAMISYYFGSKEKLFEAMFAHRSESFKLQLETMVQNKEMEPMEKMYQLIDQYILKLTNQQCFHRIMVREQMINGHGFIASQIHALKTRNQELIKQLIKEGQDKGVFKKDIDVPLMMMTMVGTVSQLVTTRHFYREINGLQSLSEEEFDQHIKTKLSGHLKKIFKAILSNEE